MKLVIDANELFAGVIIKGRGRQSKTLDILFSDEVELFAPFRLLAEMENNRSEIRKKSGFCMDDFESFVEVIKLRIKFVPLEEVTDEIPDAKKICPDPKDLEYFALALKLKCSIWSEEKLLKEQSKIKVFTTYELKEVIKQNKK